MILASISINEFLSNNALWIALGFVGLIIVVVAIILIVSHVNKEKNKINPNENNELFDALGGKDNLISASLKGSRLTIKIKTNEKINQDKLKDIGIDNTIVMSNQITLILNDKTKEEFKDFKLD